MAKFQQWRQNLISDLTELKWTLTSPFKTWWYRYWHQWQTNFQHRWPNLTKTVVAISRIFNPPARLGFPILWVLGAPLGILLPSVILRISNRYPGYNLGIWTHWILISSGVYFLVVIGDHLCRHAFANEDHLLKLIVLSVILTAPVFGFNLYQNISTKPLLTVNYQPGQIAMHNGSPDRYTVIAKDGTTYHLDRGTYVRYSQTNVNQAEIKFFYHDIVAIIDPA